MSVVHTGMAYIKGDSLLGLAEKKIGKKIYSLLNLKILW